MTIKMTVTSTKDLRKLRRFFKNVSSDIAKNAFAAAQPVAEKSAREVLNLSRERTPNDTGELVASSNITVITTGGRGGPLGTYKAWVIHYDAPYAAFVHEDLEAIHTATGPNKKNPAKRSKKRGAPQGQAKFLETALNEQREEILKAISEAILVGVRRKTS